MTVEFTTRYAPTIRKFFADDTFMRLLLGPFGSGKSSACCIEILQRAMRQAPDKNGIRHSKWGIIRNTFRELRDTTLPTWTRWAGEFGDWKISDYDFTIREMPVGDGTIVNALVSLRPLDRPQDTKNLLSLELTGCWINEMREVPKSIVTMMRGRVNRFPPINKDGTGGATWAGVFGDSNPPDTDHWMYRMFEEEQPYACLTCRTKQNQMVLLPSRRRDNTIITVEERKCPGCGKGIEGAFPLTSVWHQPSGFSDQAENLPFLPQSYYQNLAAGEDQEFVKVYCMGLYGYVKDGKPVYLNYDPEVHYSQSILKAMPGYPITLSFDSTGRNQACICTQYMPTGQQRVLHEWLVEGTDARSLCREVVRPFIWSTYPGIQIFFTGDPAGVRRSDSDSRNSFMEIAEAFKGRDGTLPEITPARSNSLDARIGAVNTFLLKRLGKEPAIVVSQACKLTHRGFMGEYKMKRLQVVGKEIYKDTPEKNLVANLHDALQYACMLTEDMHDLMRKNRPEDMPQQVGTGLEDWGAWV